ncbi:MAG: DUF1292 domain-containing protein [Oscillospiraceae bacterium]|nr:DUF1292 domain-containing protein [Oscillospiraceae bacterium]
MDELDNILVLNDADGNEVQFEYLASVDYEGDEYIVLMPMEGDDTEVVILLVQPVEGSDEEEAYIGVTDEAILEAVFEIFKEQFSDIFEFEE